MTELPPRRHPSLKSLAGCVAVAATGAFLAGCYRPAYRVEPRPEETPPAPSTRLYFYPMEGQSVARQDRDRYECHRWAVKKTGFDPGRTPLAPHQRVEVISEPPPGTNTAAGAVSGAMIGALLSRPHDTGEGLVFGAITGAVLGAASESAQQQRTRQLQYHYDKDYTRRYARAERQAHNFRRAMTACLEGRGYSVR